MQSPTGFRQLLPQDQGLTTGTPPVRIHLDNTNTGNQQPDQQHFVQETQQLRPDQPGYLAQDLQTHLQQQVNGRVTPTIVAPTPTHPNQEQALQDLQRHIDWFQSSFGHSPIPNAQSNPLIHLNQPITNHGSPNPLEAQTSQQQPPMINIPGTPVSNVHSQTVPNTPQHYAQSWPSPPPTDVKHVRSQSFQYDVAPMPVAYDGNQSMKVASSPYAPPQHSFTQDSFASNDAGYASSVYSSSAIDPMSPGRQTTVGGMPTVFEEATPLMGNGFSGDALFHAVAGASDDFNSPNFIIGGPMGGMSPRTAMLHNLGEDVNASIVETGVPSEQVDAYISPQDPISKGWSCMHLEDNGKPCGKFFKRKENARSHVQNHLGDRQFQCNDCGKTFVRQHDMKRHAAIHKDDRPHVCPCGSGFARHDALTRHRQRGMCKGALPGYEKNEEDKPKRGRPKKERPDMELRTSKAKRARRMDRANGGAMASYASSHSSGMTDNSLPMTPPDSSDFIDAQGFINLVQTPPTSPPSPQKSSCISPAALLSNVDSGHGGSFTGVSSPENGMDVHDDFNFGAIEAQPGVAQQALFSDPFSPEYSSMPASSPNSGMEENDTAPGDCTFSLAWGDLISPAGMGEGTMASMLDQWIASQ